MQQNPANICLRLSFCQEQIWERDQEHQDLFWQVSLLQHQVQALTSSQTSERGVVGLTVERTRPWRVLAVNEVLDEHGLMMVPTLKVEGYSCVSVRAPALSDLQLAHNFSRMTASRSATRWWPLMIGAVSCARRSQTFSKKLLGHRARSLSLFSETSQVWSTSGESNGQWSP